jgi:arsenite/tail-anchored protein-transporting ATPase
VDPRRFMSASRVFIVAGKGGVGKSTVAAALVTAARRIGLTALLVETDGKPLMLGGTADAGLSAQTITPSDALAEYLDRSGLGRISRRLISSGIVDVVASASPGIDHLLVLGKVKQLERSKAADVIVVDGPAAGHALTMLRTPRALAESVVVGPIRQQANDVLSMLNDERRCQVVLVTIPEPTPVNEAVETAFALEEDIGVRLAPIVINRVDDHENIPIPDSVSSTSGLVRAARFRNTRIDGHTRCIADLEHRLPLPQLRLPLDTTATIDEHATQLLAAIERLPEPPDAP